MNQTTTKYSSQTHNNTTHRENKNKENKLFSPHNNKPHKVKQKMMDIILPVTPMVLGVLALFATIIKREPEQIKKGIIVGFLGTLLSTIIITAKYMNTPVVRYGVAFMWIVTIPILVMMKNMYNRMRYVKHTRRRKRFGKQIYSIIIIFILIIQPLVTMTASAAGSDTGFEIDCNMVNVLRNGFKTLMLEGVLALAIVLLLAAGSIPAGHTFAFIQGAGTALTGIIAVLIFVFVFFGGIVASSIAQTGSGDNTRCYVKVPSIIEPVFTDIKGISGKGG